MYGGVGIVSAKGTGTNGYVERALGYLPKDYKPGSYGEIIRQMKSNPAPVKRKINDEIILHEEKHKIEVELYDLKEKYIEEKKYSMKEIEEKINKERKRLYCLLERREAEFMDKNETHQKGKLKDAQMKILGKALSIKDDYYMGEGFEEIHGDIKDKNKKHKHRSKHKHKRRHEGDDSVDDAKKDEFYKKKKKYRYRNDYYREYDGRTPSQSRSRSRSRSKNYNNNIKKEINNDYRLNKKIKLAESVFRKSPSPPGNQEVIRDEVNKEEIEKIKNKDDKGEDKNKIVNKDSEANKGNEEKEHEEGSIDN